MKRILFALFIIASVGTKAQTKCNAAFTYTINKNIVSFSSADSLPYAASIWYFGDGNIGWASYYTYNYNSPGTYTVKHVVTDSSAGCADSSVQIINVNFTPSCAAAFQYSRDSTHLSNYFFYDASTIVGGSISSYSWTINNNVVANTQSFGYAFPQAGTYNVCEQIQTSSGGSSQSCQNVIVSSTDSCSLKVSFTYSPQPSNPLAVQFASIVNTNSTVSYSWNFGDSTSDSTKNPVHVYSKGIYYPILYVFSADSILNCSAYYTIPVYVNIGPADTCSVSFTYSANPSNPNQISFTANSGQPIASQNWTIVNAYAQFDSLPFNYNNPIDSSGFIHINGNNPTYVFADSGTYSAMVQITTQAGCVVSSGWQYIGIDSIAKNALAPDSSSQVTAYPNPATNSVNLNLALPSSSNVIINIFNSMGNLILTQQSAGTAGSNQVAIPVQTLKPGVYYVEINYGGYTKRSRFQKM